MRHGNADLLCVTRLSADILPVLVFRPQLQLAASLLVLRRGAALCQ